MLLGEHAGCFTLLDGAARMLRDHPEVSHPHVPVYLHYYDLDTLQEQSGLLSTRWTG